MTIIDDEYEDQELDLAAPETRPTGRWNSAGVPGERSKDFKSALARLAHARPDVDRARVRVRRRDRERRAQRIRPACARAWHRHHRPRRDQPSRDRLRRPPPRAARGDRALRRLVAAADRRRVHARRGHPAVDVQAAIRRRGQGQRPSAQLHRQAATRRSAQPRHQRHRQRRAEPATDAQPDAHVGAAAAGSRDHDVHDLAAARARCADDCAGVGLRHARPRAKGSGRDSSRNGRARAS